MSKRARTDGTVATTAGWTRLAPDLRRSICAFLSFADKIKWTTHVHPSLRLDSVHYLPRLDLDVAMIERAIEQARHASTDGWKKPLRLWLPAVERLVLRGEWTKLPLHCVAMESGGLARLRALQLSTDKGWWKHRLTMTAAYWRDVLTQCPQLVELDLPSVEALDPLWEVDEMKGRAWTRVRVGGSCFDWTVVLQSFASAELETLDLGDCGQESFGSRDVELPPVHEADLLRFLDACPRLSLFRTQLMRIVRTDVHKTVRFRLFDLSRADIVSRNLKLP